MKQQPDKKQGKPEPETETPVAAKVFDFSPVRLSEAVPGNGFIDDNLFVGEEFIDDSDTNHWSVPWSDLMMVMFVLFAALLTAQALESQVPEPVVQPVARVETEQVPDPVGTKHLSFEPLMRINVFERSQQAVREAQIENVEIVILEDQSVKVSVQGPMFFELGKADLRRDMRQFLTNLAKVIKQTPYQVHVVGHTDDYPINTTEFPSNWELSVSRAARVVRYLVDQGGVDPYRFTVMGRSEFDPLMPNADDQARAQNRRVEIIITREIGDPLSGAKP
ncbi:MAG: flagellar motor protein MotB [Gammaproteobacteria bacterium]|nr:flagellar motor protein MotB [Gammaproteobacteria bacterium]MDH3448697.1 flagellar motor protein MotB [Gammaproteobacteria bacterium]